MSALQSTIDLSHRIRQHNGELSGGAHRTSTKGPGWVCLLYVQGFQSRTESLQFEYALKREAKHHGYSTQARKRAVHALLSQEHWTSRPLEAVTVDQVHSYDEQFFSCAIVNKPQHADLDDPSEIEDNIQRITETVFETGIFWL